MNEFEKDFTAANEAATFLSKFSKVDAENRIHAVQMMMKTPGWDYLMQVYTEARGIRIGLALRQTTDINQILSKEFMAGAAEGLKVAMELPDVMIDYETENIQAAIRGEEAAPEEDPTLSLDQILSHEHNEGY